MRIAGHPPAASTSRARTTGAGAALAYVVLVAVIEGARASGVGPRVGDLASSPGGVASGRLWELFTSGLVVAGDPVPQLFAIGAVAATVIAVLGPRAFWRAALAGHVGATLVAYAAVGVLWLFARPDVDGVIDAPDYGISCVWAGAVGALLAGTARRPGARWLGVASAAIFVAVIPLSTDLAGVEHVLAFALGGLVTVAGTRRSGSAIRA